MQMICEFNKSFNNEIKSSWHLELRHRPNNNSFSSNNSLIKRIINSNPRNSLLSSCYYWLINYIRINCSINIFNKTICSDLILSHPCFISLNIVIIRILNCFWCVLDFSLLFIIFLFCYWASSLNKRKKLIP